MRNEHIKTALSGTRRVCVLADNMSWVQQDELLAQLEFRLDRPDVKQYLCGMLGGDLS